MHKLKRKILSLLYIGLSGFLLIFSGCDYGTVGADDASIPGALPLMLRGSWVYFSYSSPADSFTITPDTVQYHDGAGGGIYSYTGDIRFVSNFSSDSGVIIIQYHNDKRPSYPLYNGNDFFAVYYRSLKDHSVQLANATTFPNYTAPDTSALEEAVAKFTLMQMGNYVDWSVVQSYEK